MEGVTLTEEEFDNLSDLVSKVHMSDDGYIPSEMDLFDFIEKHPERYYKYLLWFSEHRPKALTEEERNRIKQIIKITNKAIKIV